MNTSRCFITARDCTRLSIIKPHRAMKNKTEMPREILSGKGLPDHIFMKGEMLGHQLAYRPQGRSRKAGSAPYFFFSFVKKPTNSEELVGFNVLAVRQHQALSVYCSAPTSTPQVKGGERQVLGLLKTAYQEKPTPTPYTVVRPPLLVATETLTTAFVAIR